MKDSNQPAPVDLAEVIASKRSHPSSKKYSYLIGILLVLGLALWYFFGFRSSSQPRGPNFATQTIKRGDIRLTVTATGNLEPTNEVSVGSELSGTTLEVYVDSNDQVTQGQALARLDTSTLENQLKSSRAKLESSKAQLSEAQATLKEAEATLARQTELARLSAGRIPSQASLSATEATVTRAQASVLSAQAAIKEAQADIETREYDLSKGTIRAPTDGVVLSRSIEPGQTVAASFSTPELFVIAENLSQMKLEVAVAEADIGRVASGQNATFAVDAWPSRSFEASVLKVSYGSEITDNVVTYATELSVSNEDLSLRPGMTATADIDVAYHQNVLLVPDAALRFTPQAPGDPGAASPSQEKSFIDSLLPRPPRSNAKQSSKSEALPAVAKDGGATIWILQDDRPAPVKVQLGLSDGGYTEVISEELNEGALVIVGENQNRRMNTSSHPLIELQNLTKTFGQGSAAFQALKGIDLKIEKGEFVSIMGPSGSGKSTLMNLLGCLDHATSGSYRYDEIAVETLNSEQLSLLRRYALGFIFQGFNLLARTSAIENVELPLLYRGIKRAQRRSMAREALALVGLPDKERNTPSELSGGQQQRVAIARAIVTNPSTLFADEPTGNLDSQTTLEIMEILRQLNTERGITILMVTHEDDVAAYAQRTIRIVDGLIERDQIHSPSPTH